MDGLRRISLLLAAKRARWNLWNKRDTAPQRRPQPRSESRNASFSQIGLADQSASDIHGGLFTLLRRTISAGDATWRERRLCFNVAAPQVLKRIGDDRLSSLLPYRR